MGNFCSIYKMKIDYEYIISGLITTVVATAITGLLLTIAVIAINS